jgi:hypothetical protein
VISRLTIRNGGNPDLYFDGGGVLIASGARATLREVTVSGNVTYTFGAGIYNAGTVTVDRSRVTGNATNAGGSGIYNEGTLLVNRSTISGNGAEDVAGGLMNYGRLTMANSTVSGNGAVYGVGGIVNYGTVTLNNVTITRNNAGFGSSGGIDNTRAGSVVTLSNTIIAGNTSEGQPADCGGTLKSAGYNLFGTTAGCAVTGNLTGNLSGVSARLGALTNNGGPTPTHALLAGSPAINAGNPATPGAKEPVCIAKDQRLKQRGATRCDIGAFEVQ